MAPSLSIPRAVLQTFAVAPHIPSTGFIRAVKLTNIAGAYWRGNEKNKMLTRIYGITFPSQKELDEYPTW